MLSFPGNDFHVNCLRSSSGHQLGESALLNKTSLNVLAPDFSRPCCQTRPSQQKLAGWCCWWTSCPRPLSIPDDDGQHGVDVVDEHMFGLLSTFFVFAYLCICLFAYFTFEWLISLNPMLLKNIAHVGSFKHFVFVYLRYLCILHFTHGKVIFDILESHVFEKYDTCWVF